MDKWGAIMIVGIAVAMALMVAGASIGDALGKCH